MKPNENPHRCPCCTQRFRKGRIRVGRKCFQGGSGDVYTDLSTKRRSGQKAVEKAITLEEVRSVLANLSRSGQKETVLKLLQNVWRHRLSEVHPERYAASICRLHRRQPMPNKHAIALGFLQCPDGWRVRPLHSFVLSCRIP